MKASIWQLCPQRILDHGPRYPSPLSKSRRTQVPTAINEYDCTNNHGSFRPARGNALKKDIFVHRPLRSHIGPRELNEFWMTLPSLTLPTLCLKVVSPALTYLIIDGRRGRLCYRGALDAPHGASFGWRHYHTVYARDWRTYGSVRVSSNGEGDCLGMIAMLESRIYQNTLEIAQLKYADNRKDFWTTGTEESGQA